MRMRTMARWAAGALMLTAALGGPALAQEKKKLTFLSWNLPSYEQTIRGWIADFEAKHPDFKVEWLDKTGSDWATFYQTQVVAGTAPDIIDVQGNLWAEYASNGQLLDLKPMLDADPETRARFTPGALDIWALDGKTYMLPFYFTKSLLIYNKKLFGEAGLTAPPKSFDELMAHAEKLSGNGRTGFISLNYDWLYWALFDMNGVKLLSPDHKKAAFNTPEMLRTLTRLAAATKAGHIDKISWTGRWVEPNSAFATGNIGMHQAITSAVFWIAGRANWMNAETAGVAPLPGGAAVPNAHGFGISKSTKYPKEAYEFVKIATNDKWQTVFANTYSALTLNKKVDDALIAKVKTSDPLKAAALEISASNLDRLTGPGKTGVDAQLVEAFWPPIQAALLGQKEPAAAIAEAEAAVNRVLRRAP